MTSPTCSRTEHLKWAEWRDDTGHTIALICAGCAATVPPPEAEPGVRLVELPGGWEDEELSASP